MVKAASGKCGGSRHRRAAVNIPVERDLPPQSRALAEQFILNGYRIEGLLGEGGFGITYLARDLLDQVFVLKE